MSQSPSTIIPNKFWAIGILILAAGAAVLCLRLQLDNRLDRMLSETGQEAQDYQHLLNRFGSDEFVMIATSGKPIFEEAALDAMLAALDRLDEVPHVYHVAGIPTVFRDRFGEEDPEALEEEITSTPFYHGLFISEDATTAGILLQTEILDEPESRRDMVKKIREAIAPLREYGFDTYLVGVPVFDVDLNAISMRESLRTFPIAAVASLIVLFALLRSFRAAAVVISCGVISLLLTMGLIGLAGRPLNVVTAILPLLLWVLALANCIHLVCRYQFYRLSSTTIEEAVAKALQETRFPCILSAVTTAVGFFSLIIAEVGPIRELGLLMSAGMIISVIVNLLLGPNLLIYFKAPAPRWMANVNTPFFPGLANRIVRKPVPVIAFFALLLAGGIYSLQYIKSEPNSLRFLPKGSETLEAYNFVAKNLTGMYTLEILIDTPGSWLNDEYWPALIEFAEEFQKRDIVARVLSPMDFLKKMNQWDHDLGPEHYRLPESAERAEELMAMLDEGDTKEMRRLIRDDGEQIRLTLLINDMDSVRFSSLVQDARQRVENLPEPLTGMVTGITSRLERMQRALVRTQVNTFGLAFLMVFFAIFVGLRSARLTAISIIPNLVPILSAFTVMAIFGINLDAATVMVASVALGIAVDDTVHLLAGYRRERQAGKENSIAIRDALTAVGPSISVTTLTACIGFFTLATSAFIPVADFGRLAGIAMIWALAADLLFVPALLAVLPGVAVLGHSAPAAE